MKYFYFSNAQEESIYVLYGNPEVKIVQFVIV